ncbi:MAG: hypothetical protein LHW56_08565 [Candidatus Cloacimonetes bacterium]|nr:hypothetical protein [Candidatus Cloacimonadota bacterium]MDY0172947.1 hypothetical protein [Candidatus Cloacimonadaceae bacterium]
MAKAIKFNILVDKTPLRDINDLHEHFNLDDLLAHQQSGLLQRWLEVRGLTELAERVASLSSAGPLAAAQELCRTFHPESTPEHIAAAVYPLEYAMQHAARLEELKKSDFARQQVIDDYHSGYARVLQKMFEHPEDYPLIKSALSEIWNMYMGLFRLDFDRFFVHCLHNYPFILFAITANQIFRQDSVFAKIDLAALFDIASSIKKSNINIKRDTNHTWQHVTNDEVRIESVENLSGDVNVKDLDGNEYAGTTAIGKILKGLFFYSNRSTDSVEYILLSDAPKPPFFSYGGETANYWKDIEPRGKYFMILKMEPGNFVRNCGRSGEELNAEHVNGQFPILDGIDYKSNNAADQLLYMEV